MGARILSVVDCYDALTSDRPYRRAMTDQAALAILRERRGTMYDPQVVDTFVAVYREIQIGDADTPAQRDVIRRIADSRAESAPNGDVSFAPTAVAVPSVSDEVLAFVSLAQIAGGDGRVADVLALSSRLIRGIVPDATGAFYLLDGGRTELRVAESFGPSASVLQGISVRVGQRLTGWVAASRQPIVNSDAALDLEDLAERAMPALRSCLSVPLLRGETLVGVLTIYSTRAAAFDDTHGRVMQMIAPHIASALHAAGRSEVSLPAGRAERAGGSRELQLVRR